MFACNHEPLKMLKLRSAKAAAASQPHRIEARTSLAEQPARRGRAVARCGLPSRRKTGTGPHDELSAPGQCIPMRFPWRRFSLGSCPARIDLVELIHPEAIFIGCVEPELCGANVEASTGSLIGGLVHDRYRSHSAAVPDLFSRYLPKEFVEPRVVRLKIDRSDLRNQLRVGDGFLAARTIDQDNPNLVFGRLPRLGWIAECFHSVFAEIDAVVWLDSMTSAEEHG